MRVDYAVLSPRGLHAFSPGSGLALAESGPPAGGLCRDLVPEARGIDWDGNRPRRKMLGVEGEAVWEGSPVSL